MLSILLPLVLSVSFFWQTFLVYLNPVRPIISIYAITTIRSGTFAKSALFWRVFEMKTEDSSGGAAARPFC